MGQGRSHVGGMALLTVTLLALAGPTRADWRGRWVEIGIGPWRDPRYTNSEGNIPGLPRALAPSYGYYPDYSYNWPSLHEALALKRAGLTPCDVRPQGGAAYPPAPAMPVELRVLVPADAEVWVGGSPTGQRGTERRFVTPPLEGGRHLFYEIRAHWQEQGRDVERVRIVPVYPGDRLTVDFLTSEAGPPQRP